MAWNRSIIRHCCPGNSIPGYGLDGFGNVGQLEPITGVKHGTFKGQEGYLISYEGVGAPGNGQEILQETVNGRRLVAFSNSSISESSFVGEGSSSAGSVLKAPCITVKKWGRLMVSLLILKYVRNLSDEYLVEQWSENNYFQYFSGEQFF